MWKDAKDFIASERNGLGCKKKKLQQPQFI